MTTQAEPPFWPMPPATPIEKLAVDIGRQPLDADQFATKFYEIEVELDAPIEDAASRRGTRGPVSTPAQRSRFRPRLPPPSRALIRYNIMARSYPLDTFSARLSNLASKVRAPRGPSILGASHGAPCANGSSVARPRPSPRLS